MKPPKHFWLAAALYCWCLGQDTLQHWRAPAEFPYQPPPVNRPAVDPVFQAMRYVPKRISHPLRLGQSAPQEYAVNVRLEEPLFYTKLHLRFAAQPGSKAVLHVPVPPDAWVDLVTVDGEPPAVIAAQGPLPPWAAPGTGTGNDLLELTVPVQAGKPVLVEVGYLQLLGPTSECVVPMPELPSSPSVRVSGTVNTWRKVPGKVEEIAGSGDLGVYRFNGGGALQGSSWTLVSGMNDRTRSRVVVNTAGGPVQWLPQGQNDRGKIQVDGRVLPRHPATLPVDSWAAWAQTPEAVRTGTRPPSREELQALLQQRILCPFTRLRFGTLPPGGVRPGR
jgi:hypothetical protein